MKEFFGATGVGEARADHADVAEASRMLPRRSVRRRLAAGAAALAMVLVGILLAVPRLGRAADQTAADPAGPTLPTEFATLSMHTSRSVDNPGGRAIALYEFGDPDGPWQTLVAGADRDTYRRVDTEEERAPDVLLSPDGRYVLYYKASRGTDEFRLLDLVTGRSEVRHAVEWWSYVAGITMLAWSPDARYVAYAVPHGTSSRRDREPLFDLAVLDVIRDTNVLVPLDLPIYGAAFSPDSQRIAVVADRQSPIITIDGEQVGTWNRPVSIITTSLDTGRTTIAWSPDGARLALSQPPTGMAIDGGTYYGPNTANIVFADPTGGQPVRTELTGSPLGWRSPTSIVVLTNVDEDLAAGDTGVMGLVELSIVDGARTVLSRFPRADDCWLAGRCAVFRPQLATTLLQRAGTRPSNPDRGSWVPVANAGPVVLALACAVVVAGIVALAVRQVSSRRRDRSHAVA